MSGVRRSQRLREKRIYEEENVPTRDVELFMNFVEKANLEFSISEKEADGDSSEDYRPEDDYQDDTNDDELYASIVVDSDTFRRSHSMKTRSITKANHRYNLRSRSRK